MIGSKTVALRRPLSFPSEGCVMPVFCKTKTHVILSESLDHPVFRFGVNTFHDKVLGKNVNSRQSEDLRVRGAKKTGRFPNFS